MKQKTQLKLKYLIVGDSGVGKTSILMRYSHNEFQQDYLSTVGVDFKVKKLQNQQYKAVLNIWDTAGQERFRTITKSFYQGSNGIIIVYSITDPISFSHIGSWISQIQANCQNKVNLMLIGCKCDLQEQRKVMRENGLKVAEQFGIPFFEVSAKLNHGIQEAFQKLTDDIFDKQHNNKPQTQLQHSELPVKIQKMETNTNNKKYVCC